MSNEIAGINPRVSTSIGQREGRHATPVQEFKVNALIVADGILQYVPRPRNPWQMVLSALTVSTIPTVAQEAFNIFTNSNRSAIVEAADPCKIQVAFHAFAGIDMFPINETGRPGKLDNTEDPKIGPGVNFIGQVLDEKGNLLKPAQVVRRTIPANIKSKLPNEFDRNNPNLREEGYGITDVIETECNMPGRQVKVFLTTSQNPSDKEPRIIKNGDILHEVGGRLYQTVPGIAEASRSLMATDPRRIRIEAGLKDPATVKRIEQEAERQKNDREVAAGKKPVNGETPVPPRGWDSLTPRDSKDLPSWIWGIGAGFLAVLLAYVGYEQWNTRFRRGAGAGATAGTGSSAGSTPRIGGSVGAIGGPSNPNTAPNFGPTQQKNPEWVTGQQEFENKWQSAKSKLLPIQPGETGNEPEHILDRFKAGINIVHEVSLNSRISVSLMALRVRAGIEYLIPQIWPDNKTLKRFFDPNFNAGYLNVEDLARIVYLPESARNLLSFSDDQKRDIRRVRRILMYALHPDTAKVDADKSLQESIDDLLKRFNPAWSYIDNLIK